MTLRETKEAREARTHARTHAGSRRTSNGRGGPRERTASDENYYTYGRKRPGISEFCVGEDEWVSEFEVSIIKFSRED